MSGPDMEKTQCPHGFPPIVCNRCARSSPCVHGMSQGCLLCAMQLPPNLFRAAGTAAVGGPLSKTQPNESVTKAYVDGKGYVQNAKFVHSPVAALEKGSITGPNAIVLHRTDGWDAAGAMQSFAKGVGTHFLVDKDGTVTQAASLLKYTKHVGKIKSRCYDSGTCSADETKQIKSWGWAPEKLYNHEKVKSYPTRYPLSEDSIGIEVVAKHHNGAWEAATPAQLASIAIIVNFLKDTYRLGDNDIYEHDKISYKTAGEGAGLYAGGVQANPPSPKK